MNSLDCSIVICTRDRPTRLRRCLTAIASADYPRSEVIVVDNTDGAEQVRAIAWRAGARYICEPLIGLSRARNTGARAARGRIVAFIDDDAIPAREWLTCHLTAFAESRPAATTGRILLLDPDATVTRAFAALGGYDLGSSPMCIDRNTPDWFERTNFGGLGNGANLAFRRELFANGWGFPEKLGHGTGMLGEEHYALFTLVRDGQMVAYVPGAVVYHDPPNSFEALERLKRAIIRGAAAYVTMLVVEEPGYRTAALRYALRGVPPRRRAWRPPVSAQPLLPALSRLRAAAGGPLIYAKTRRGSCDLRAARR